MKYNPELPLKFLLNALLFIPDKNDYAYRMVVNRNYILCFNSH